jgi:hypothetical protein
MNYVKSLTDALTIRHDLLFIPLRYSYVTFTPHFTALRLIYHFPNTFPKNTWFTGESLKHLQVIGSRAGWSYLQRNIFRCLLLSAPTFPIISTELSRLHEVEGSDLKKKVICNICTIHPLY